MINRSLTALTVALALGVMGAASASASDSLTGKTGFGFQGVVLGNYINGASVRGWTSSKFGWEGNLMYGALKGSLDGSPVEFNGDLTALEAKGMYALVEKANSKMFVGAKVLFGRYKLDASIGNHSMDLVKGNLWQPGIFAGAEWCIPQLPEVGFNFEVGYNYGMTKPTFGKDMKVDLKLHGINAAIGMHYYF